MLTPAIAAADVVAPAVSAARLLVPAAVVLLALGGALLLPGGRATAARPALAVAWVVVPLSAAAVLDTVLTAAEIADVGPGRGAWATLVAMVAGACCALASAVECNAVDVSALAARPVDRPLLLAVGLVAVLAVPAFALPVATGAGYRAGAIRPRVRADRLGPGDRARRRGARRRGRGHAAPRTRRRPPVRVIRAPVGAGLQSRRRERRSSGGVR